jgi:hypothetical protein
VVCEDVMLKESVVIEDKTFYLNNIVYSLILIRLPLIVLVLVIVIVIIPLAISLNIPFINYDEVFDHDINPQLNQNFDVDLDFDLDLDLEFDCDSEFNGLDVKNKSYKNIIITAVFSLVVVLIICYASDPCLGGSGVKSDIHLDFDFDFDMQGPFTPKTLESVDKFLLEKAVVESVKVK